MGNQKKFGAFAGVFTPSILTILGVIMFMRLGWVVGNAGLVGTIAIIVIAHIISITTGLSISSIATDKRVGPGGVYYVLSRSLGLPIGGAIGITLFVGTALSIALYVIGFGESFLPYFGLTADINGLRVGGTIALAILTTLAFISTSLAMRAQFFIMAAIIISLVSIFLGVSPQIPEEISYILPAENVSMEIIFAIFFPAVTGFTAGIAMSGDLKDPKKAIPNGTLWAIGVGFVVYIVLAIFLFFNVDGELLRTDNNILLKMAYFAPAVVAGIWGATLSSALGGILGGPRIMQAMSVDKITPKLFARGVGKGNDPRNALLLTVLIAEAGILIGDLDTIARVCSMFYLAAYGFINLSFFLESWVSTDFKPTFKVKKWIGLLGFIATFIVMFRLDMVAMIVAIIVIGGIYFWLAKKELELGSGDIWQSVWSSVVKTGLRKMDEKQDHKRNWKPNVLLFSGGTEQRPYLLEFSKDLVGNRGIVTNFDLFENEEAAVLFPKHEQSVNDEILKKHGVFGRKIEVKNIFQGIESIASTFGFSGIEPNTILMGWAKNTSDPIWFAQMTHRLMALDYNVLYLDYDSRYGFRKCQEIDLWWRGTENNAELMLKIGKFLLSSDQWRNAKIRILLVDNTNTTKKVIEKKIQRILDENRLSASIKIIGNATDKRHLYELMKIYSSEADLILVGIPKVELDNPKSFVLGTNDLVRTIGTTLLVRASTQFDEIRFISPTTNEDIKHLDKTNKTHAIKALTLSFEGTLHQEIAELNQGIEDAYTTFVSSAFKPIENKYTDLYAFMQASLNQIDFSDQSHSEIYKQLLQYIQKMKEKVDGIRTSELPIFGNIMKEENLLCQEKLQDLFKNIPKKSTLHPGSAKIPFRKIAVSLKDTVLIPDLHQVLSSFGNSSFENLTSLINEINSKIYHLFIFNGFNVDPSKFNSEIESTVLEIKNLTSSNAPYFRHLSESIQNRLISSSRNFATMLDTVCSDNSYPSTLKSAKGNGRSKLIKSKKEQILNFPANWTNNQLILHSTMATDLGLAQVQGRVNIGLKDITNCLEEEVNNRVEHQFQHHTNNIQSLHKQYSEGKDISSTDELEMDERPFIRPETLIQRLHSNTLDIQQIINAEVNLMTQILFDDFRSEQHEDHRPIRLDLLKIVDYILESKLYGPFQSHIDHYLTEVNNEYFNETNRVNLLKYALKEATNPDEIEHLFNKVEQSLLEEKEALEVIQLRFVERIRSILYDLHMELNSRYLVSNADNWSRFISVSKRKRGLAKANELIKSKFTGLYDTVNTTLATKRYESEVSVFEAHHNLKSEIELGRSFVESLFPTPEVESELPFYYKQLFLGKHIPVQGTYKGRPELAKHLLSEVLQQTGTVLLIGGNSGSGKTHLANYLAEKSASSFLTINSKTTRGDMKALNHAFNRTTRNKSKGNIKQCMAKLKAGSTVFIDDIEVWWDRNMEFDPLHQLLDSIKHYGKRHSFIMTGNVNSMEALKNSSILHKVVTHTITLPPVNKESIREIVLERHKVGGMDLSYMEEINNFNSKEFNNYLSKVHEESQGNIGLALQMWLSNIDSVRENTLSVEMLNPPIYMKVESKYWKWILYQIILNNNLTTKDISKLFGAEANFVMEQIEEMTSAKIIEKVARDSYTIRNNVKYSIENWLKQAGIFN